MKFMLLLLAVFYTISCSHDDCILEDDIHKSECADSLSSKGEEDTRYYVKYEVYMPLGYSGQETSRLITFVSEKGLQSIRTSNSTWEGIYGPLKKNTKLYVNVKAESGGIRTNIEYYVRLSVSRDKEPFVVKGEQRNKQVSSLSTSYTIDF